MVEKSDTFTLDFVNEGKEFKFLNWTTEMHEAAMAQMLEDNPSATNEQRDSLFRYYVIYTSLGKIDNNVSLEDVKNLHPENLVVLFNAAYYAGKRDIYFRKG